MVEKIAQNYTEKSITSESIPFIGGRLSENFETATL